MKVYHVTHPAHPKAVMRVSVDAKGRVDKLYISGAAFVATGSTALATMERSIDLPADVYLNSLKLLGCSVKEDTAKLPTNEKVALWCRLWKEYKGEKWVISGPDAKRIGEMAVDEPFLRWYLNDKEMPDTPQTWLWKGKQSVGNLWHYINQVRVAMAAPPPSKHPDHWDRAHLAKLDGQGIGEYHRHLRALGLVAKKHPDGTILDYVKPTA